MPTKKENNDEKVTPITKKRATTTKKKTSATSTKSTKKTTSTSTPKKTATRKKKAPEPTMTAGDKKCYIYFDMNLTENSRKANIISVSFCNYLNKTFYAEATDFVKTDKTSEEAINMLMSPNNKFEGDNWTMRGNREEISSKLIEWLNEVNPDKNPIQFVSDISHFKFVMLLDMLGDNKPDYISDVCLDLNQDIATSIQRINSDNLPEEEFNKNFIPLVEARHLDRFNYAKSVEDLTKYEGLANHPLITSILIKTIHQFLWKL